MSNVNSPKKVQKFSKAASGVTSQFPSTTKLNLLGTTYTPAQLASSFTAVVQGLDALAASRAQLEAQLTALANTEVTATALYEALKQFIIATYGKGSPILQQFGYVVAAPKKRTVAQKAVAQGKADPDGEGDGRSEGEVAPDHLGAVRPAAARARRQADPGSAPRTGGASGQGRAGPAAPARRSAPPIGDAERRDRAPGLEDHTSLPGPSFFRAIDRAARRR